MGSFDTMYDQDGNPIEDKIDGRVHVLDGTFSQRANGDTPPSAWELQTPADGTSDLVIDQEYDGMDRRTSYRREVNGNFDTAATWTFDACSEFL